MPRIKWELHFKSNGHLPTCDWSLSSWDCRIWKNTSPSRYGCELSCASLMFRCRSGVHVKATWSASPSPIGRHIPSARIKRTVHHCSEGKSRKYLWAAVPRSTPRSARRGLCFVTGRNGGSTNPRSPTVSRESRSTSERCDSEIRTGIWFSTGSRLTW